MSFLVLCQSQDVGICAFLISHVLWFSRSSAIPAPLIPTLLFAFFSLPRQKAVKMPSLQLCCPALGAESVLCCWAARWHFWILSALLFFPDPPGDAKASKPLVLTQARLSWVSGTQIWCFQHLRLELEVSSLHFAMQIFPWFVLIQMLASLPGSIWFLLITGALFICASAAALGLASTSKGWFSIKILLFCFLFFTVSASHVW